MRDLEEWNGVDWSFHAWLTHDRWTAVVPLIQLFPPTSTWLSVRTLHGIYVGMDGRLIWISRKAHRQHTKDTTHACNSVWRVISFIFSRDILGFVPATKCSYGSIPTIAWCQESIVWWARMQRMLSAAGPTRSRCEFSRTAGSRDTGKEIHFANHLKTHQELFGNVFHWLKITRSILLPYRTSVQGKVKGHILFCVVADLLSLNLGV